MPKIDGQAIYERDGGLCGICGDPVSLSEAELDHVIHRWRGGPSTPDNLRIAHRLCNQRRGRREHPPVGRSTLLNFIANDELRAQLDTYRHSNRFPSRAAAVKALLRWTLDQQPKLNPER